jgi:hypothetical protein
MESRYTRCCRLGRMRRNSVGSRRICFYACCVGSAVSRDRLMHRGDGDIPACDAGRRDTAPLRRVVVLLQSMLLPATLLGLGSLGGARRRLVVADSILCTLLRHDLTCTVLSLSRHVQTSPRRRRQREVPLAGAGGRGRSDVSKGRDRQSGCLQGVTRCRRCQMTLIDGEVAVSCNRQSCLTCADG